MLINKFSSNNTYIFALKLGVFLIGMTLGMPLGTVIGKAIGTDILKAYTQINVSQIQSTDLEMISTIPHQDTFSNIV